MFDIPDMGAEGFEDMTVVRAKANAAAGALLEAMAEATRAENQAAGSRLVAVSELDKVRLHQWGAQETWCSDTASAITGEIAAALRISRNAAESDPPPF